MTMCKQQNVRLLFMLHAHGLRVLWRATLAGQVTRQKYIMFILKHT